MRHRFLTILVVPVLLLIPQLPANGQNLLTNGPGRGSK